MRKAKTAYFKALRAEVPELMKIATGDDEPAAKVSSSGGLGSLLVAIFISSGTSALKALK